MLKGVIISNALLPMKTFWEMAVSFKDLWVICQSLRKLHNSDIDRFQSGGFVGPSENLRTSKLSSNEPLPAYPQPDLSRVNQPRFFIDQHSSLLPDPGFKSLFLFWPRGKGLPLHPGCQLGFQRSLRSGCPEDQTQKDDRWNDDFADFCPCCQSPCHKIHIDQQKEIITGA